MLSIKRITYLTTIALTGVGLTALTIGYGSLFSIGNVDSQWYWTSSSSYSICSKISLVRTTHLLSRHVILANTPMRDNDPAFVMTSPPEPKNVRPFSAIGDEVCREYYDEKWHRCIMLEYGFPLRCAASMVALTDYGWVVGDGFQINDTHFYQNMLVHPTRYSYSSYVLNSIAWAMMFFVLLALHQKVTRWIHSRMASTRCECGYPRHPQLRVCPECGSSIQKES